MTPTELTRLHEAATPGPWFTSPYRGSTGSQIWAGRPGPTGAKLILEEGDADDEDAALIVYLRNHVPDILAMQSRIGELEEALATQDGPAETIDGFETGNTVAPNATQTDEELVELVKHAVRDVGTSCGIWLTNDEARAAIAILKRELAKAKADAEMLAEALEGFIAELTSNMTNRSKMLTINQAALVRRIAHAHEALAALKEPRTMTRRRKG